MSITCCITCSRIHYMLPNPLHAPESITCSRIHYMLPNPLHGITFFGIHYMHLLSLHGIYMPSQHVSCISRPAQTGTAIAPRSLTSQMLPLAMPGTGAVAGSSSISSTHVDAAGTADPGPAASTIAFPPLRYVFNAVLSASRLDE